MSGVFSQKALEGLCYQEIYGYPRVRLACSQLLWQLEELVDTPLAHQDVEALNDEGDISTLSVFGDYLCRNNEA